MMKQKINILVYGYGNPGRRDDGLGPEFIYLVDAWIKENNIDYVFTDSNYQLNIEDACTIRDYDIVIFVDATIEEIHDFQLVRVMPSEKVNFTMHAMQPSFVLDLCRKLYDKSPEVFLLKIKGYDYELKEGFTEKAAANLFKAFAHVKKILLDPEKIPVLNGSEIY
ncbi:MAG: hydrogenase maturation protease [Cyclobacteriaceae bacterium]|nr:hydrogenase maturation protease [Cyclobacteriaceae bacterium]